jgi:hypothetical protein
MSSSAGATADKESASIDASMRDIWNALGPGRATDGELRQ